MDLPKVFIGSSSESIEIAQEFQLKLDNECDSSIWDNGKNFKVGSGTLESLTNKLNVYDFAIIILSPDDMIESHDKTFFGPRDNLLLEIGLFIAKLGKERCFITFDKSKNIKIPSDLAGITFVEYDTSKHEFENAISIAASKISKSIKNYWKIKQNFKNRSINKIKNNKLKKSGLKIGFSGAQSVGKTTTCMEIGYLLDKKGIEYIIHTGVARELKQRGINTDEETKEHDYGLYISKHIKKIYNELYATVQLYDRSLVDVLAYANVNGNLHPYWEQMLSDLVKITLKNFDLYFFIPIQDFLKIENDGVRNTDESYRSSINNKIIDILKANFPNLIVLNGEKHDRVQKAFDLIIKHLDSYDYEK